MADVMNMQPIYDRVHEIVDSKFSLAWKAVKKYQWVQKANSTRKAKRYGSWHI